MYLTLTHDDSPWDWSDLLGEPAARVYYSSRSRYTLGTHETSDLSSSLFSELRACNPPLPVLRALLHDTLPPRTADPYGVRADCTAHFRHATRHGQDFADALLEWLESSDLSASTLAAAIEESGGICRPVYAYVHSGATISLGSFGDPWDSGLSGYAVLTSTDIKREGWADRDAALSYLRGMIRSIDAIIQGHVYRADLDDGDASCCAIIAPDGDASAILSSVSDLCPYLTLADVENALDNLDEPVEITALAALNRGRLYATDGLPTP